MKKAAAISLLFLFLFTNSGIAVNVHWCRGKITSVKFFENDKYGCKCGKKAMKRGCCKDKSVILKAPLDPAKTNQFSFNIQIPKLEVALGWGEFAVGGVGSVGVVVDPPVFDDHPGFQ